MLLATKNAIRALLRSVEYVAVNLANRSLKATRLYELYSTSDILVAHELAKRIQPGESVLDIGSSDGHRLRELMLFKDIRAHGIDLEPPPSPPGMTLQAYDGSKIPFADQTFDTSLICYVLHHLEPEHADLILREALRVTRRRVFVLEDTMPNFGFLYRVRNAMHRIESNLQYASLSTFSPVDGRMFLNHCHWHAFFARHAGIAKTSTVSLHGLEKYAHHTLFDLELITGERPNP
jgi:hypothetical protein